MISPSRQQPCITFRPCVATAPYSDSVRSMSAIGEGDTGHVCQVARRRARSTGLTSRCIGARMPVCCSECTSEAKQSMQTLYLRHAMRIHGVKAAKAGLRHQSEADGRSHPIPQPGPGLCRTALDLACTLPFHVSVRTTVLCSRADGVSMPAPGNRPSTIQLQHCLQRCVKDLGPRTVVC